MNGLLTTIENQGDTIENQGDTIENLKDMIHNQGDMIEKMKDTIHNQGETIENQGASIKELKDQIYENESCFVIRELMVRYRDDINTIDQKLQSTSRRWMKTKYLHRGKRFERYKILIKKGNYLAHEHDEKAVVEVINSWYDENGQAALKDLFCVIYGKTVEECLPDESDEEEDSSQI